jgi:hypothetical protein
MAEAGQPEGGGAQVDGARLVRGWLENSPFIVHLGITGGGAREVSVSADDGSEVALALVTYQL